MSSKESAPPSTKAGYIVGSVISKDATQIGYRQYGAGPAVVFVHGGMASIHNYHDLALGLGADFTVYVPERRGRRMSPKEYSPDHVIEREIEDLAAIFDVSGARGIFGLSSGAIIALEAARVFPSIEKLVVYEAPFYLPPQRMRSDLVVRFNREVETRNIPAAMVTAVTAAGLAPPLFKYIPRALTERVIGFVIRRNDRRGRGEYEPFQQLVPTMRYDLKIVSSMQDKIDTFRSLTCDVLLLSGSKSPAYLRQSGIALQKILPQAQRIELEGLDHSGPWNADLSGKPEIVASAMRGFLKR